MVQQFTGKLFYAQQWPYAVVATNRADQTVSLRSQDPQAPDLKNVPLSASGLALDIPPGTPVKVSYVGGQPFVSGVAPGGIRPIVPGSGSGVLNEIDAGYVLVIQNVSLVVAANYFPAGVAGGIAAESARAAAVLAGNTAILLHLNGGRVLPDAWTVP